MANTDLLHKQGNQTLSSYGKVKNKAGQTDPGQKDPGNLLPTKKVTKKGWSK